VEVSVSAQFFIALYRSLGRMTDITEDGRHFSGYDHKVHEGDGHDFYPKLGGGQGGRDYFTEVNSWLYTFHVQHVVAGLI